jgi:hypothetical protein
MPGPARSIGAASAFVALLLLSKADAIAQTSEGDPAVDWYIQAGSYMHYSDHRDYAGKPWFVGLERQRAGGTTAGLAVFNNSFDQFSQYVYVGKSFYPWKNSPNFRFKITGGVVHGYDGQHQNTSPLNWGDGWAVALIPGFGYQDGPVGVDVAILSGAGLLFLVGYEF